MRPLIAAFFAAVMIGAPISAAENQSMAELLHQVWGSEYSQNISILKSLGPNGQPVFHLVNRERMTQECTQTGLENCEQVLGLTTQGYTFVLHHDAVTDAAQTVHEFVHLKAALERGKIKPTLANLAKEEALAQKTIVEFLTKVYGEDKFLQLVSDLKRSAVIGTVPGTSNPYFVVSEVGTTQFLNFLGTKADPSIFDKQCVRKWGDIIINSTETIAFAELRLTRDRTKIALASR